MNKKIVFAVLAVVAGMIAAVIGVHVERIDYVVCDGVLHKETIAVSEQAKAVIGRWWSEVGSFSRRGVFRQDLQDLQD